MANYSWLRRVFQPFTRKRSAARKQLTRVSSLEPLETRKLLSITVTTPAGIGDVSTIESPVILTSITDKSRIAAVGILDTGSPLNGVTSGANRASATGDPLTPPLKEVDPKPQYAKFAARGIHGINAGDLILGISPRNRAIGRGNIISNFNVREPGSVPAQKPFIETSGAIVGVEVPVARGSVKNLEIFGAAFLSDKAVL